MNIFLIDNYDSFTYNLVAYLHRAGVQNITVKRNDRFELPEIAPYDKLLLSPGPGTPETAGLLKAAIRQYAATMPILGICLGHQAIGEVFGCRLQHLTQVYHGVSTDIIRCKPDYLFAALPEKFPVGRYHSWAIDHNSIAAPLEATAVDEQGIVHAIRHSTYDVRGLQFHPESIMTRQGLKIIENWLRR